MSCSDADAAFEHFLEAFNGVAGIPRIHLPYALHLESLNLTSRICDLARALDSVTVVSDCSNSVVLLLPQRPISGTTPALPQARVPFSMYIDRVLALAALASHILRPLLLAESLQQRQAASRVLMQLLGTPEILVALVQRPRGYPLRRAAEAGDRQAQQAMEHGLKAVVTMDVVIRCVAGLGKPAASPCTKCRQAN